MKNYKLPTLFVVVSAMLFASCEHVEYIDSHQVNGSELKIVSEGKVHSVPLNYFNLIDDEEERVESASIYLEDEVKTANTGFTPAKTVKTISSVSYGKYLVKRCLYKTSFEVIITSWVGSNVRKKYIPIYFEAEEVWLNGKRVLEQPFVFEKISTEITELDLEDGETGIYAKYLLDFQVVVHNRYFESQSEPFICSCYVTRLNKSDIFVSPDDIIVIVNYDWHPGD